MTSQEDPNEIEVTQRRIQEAKEWCQAKEDELLAANGQLREVLDNPKKRTRGGKHLEDKIQNLIERLQGELQNGLRDMENLQRQLVLQMSSKPPGNGSSQHTQPSPPGGPLVGERATAPPDSTDEQPKNNGVVDQSGGGHTSVRMGGLIPDPTQAGGVGAIDEPGVNNATMASEEQPTKQAKSMTEDSASRSNLNSTAAVSPRPAGSRVPDIPATTSIPTAVPPESSSNVDVGGLARSGVPDSALDVSPGPSELARSATGDGGASVAVTGGPASLVIPIPTDAVKSADIPSDRPHLPNDISPTMGVNEGLHAATSDTAPVQSRNLKEKYKFATHLSQKRPVEDLDHGAERKAKRGRHDELLHPHVAKRNTGQRHRGPLLSPHASQKNTAQSQRGGRGVLAPRPKKSNRFLKQWAALKYGHKVTSSQREAEHEGGDEWKGPKRHREERDSPRVKEGAKETGMARGGETGQETVKELGRKLEGAGKSERDSLVIRRGSTIDLVSDAAAAAESSDGRNNVIDEDLALESMRIHNKADLDDLKESLALQSPPTHRGSRSMPRVQKTSRRKRSGSRGPNASGRQRVAKQRASVKQDKATMQRQGAKTEGDEGEGSLSESLSGIEAADGQEGEDGEEYRDEPTEEETDDQSMDDDEGEVRTVGKGWAPPARKAWEAFSEEKKAKVTAKGRDAIGKFLAGSKKKIPTNIRSYIREIPEFLPEASSTSRALALHCLTSQYGNLLCLYHLHHDKSGKINDANPPRNYNITGVGWERRINARDRKPEVPLHTLQHKKATNCGCHQDEVLWDFYWYKTGRLHSPTVDITETWKTTRLEPRARGLMVQFVETFTCSRLQDIYAGTTDANRSRLEQLRKMEKNIRRARKELEEEMKRLAIGPDSSTSESE